MGQHDEEYSLAQDLQNPPGKGINLSKASPEEWEKQTKDYVDDMNKGSKRQGNKSNRE